VSGSEPVPPRLGSLLLRLAAGRGERREFVDELGLLYAARVGRDGRRAADRWFRAEVRALLALLARERVGRMATRARRRRPQPDALAHDVRSAWASLRAAPLIALLAVATLTLGIGANVLIFSIVDSVLLRPLPYPEPERLVRLWPRASFLRGEIALVQERATTLAEVGAYLVLPGFNAELAGGSERVSASAVAPALLPLLGVQPALGRTFTAEEAQPGGDPVVLLAHGFWLQALAGRPEVVGASLTLDGRPHAVVGVLPARLAFPDPGQDVVVPLVMDPADAGVFWGAGGIGALGRLRPGIDAVAAQAELRQIGRQARDMNPLWTPAEDFRADTMVVPMQDWLVGDVQGNLLLLLGAVGLLLLVACVNVANLLLVRGLARRHELAVRAALGAGRGRLVRQQLLESVLLVGLGCGVALALAGGALGPIVRLLPADIPRAGEIALDGRVAAVCGVLALLTGLLVGILPALQAAGVDPQAALRDGGRGGAGGTRSRRRLSSLLVVAQITAAVVLVTASGLLVRSMQSLWATDPGFDPSGLVTARLTLTGERYAAEDERRRFFAQVEQRARTLSGVRAAGITTEAPFDGSVGGFAMSFTGKLEPDPQRLPMLQRIVVTPDYLPTIGIPLQAGRELADTDDAEAPLVALVDAITAAQFWPDEDPIGQRLRYPWRDAPWLEVVGVVGAVRDQDLATPPRAGFYVPLAQVSPAAATLVLRGEGTDALAAATRELVRQLDGTVPVSRVASMDAAMAASVARRTWSAVLLSAFAAVALLLGAIGIHGVVAYAVGQQRADFGVRMALGAAPASIRRSVLLHALRLALPGVAAGLLLALPIARLAEGMLFGVQPFDVVTFALVPVVMMLATLLAAYIPSRRATRVDPMSALRS